MFEVWARKREHLGIFSFPQEKVITRYLLFSDWCVLDNSPPTFQGFLVGVVPFWLAYCVEAKRPPRLRQRHAFTFPHLITPKATSSIWSRWPAFKIFNCGARLLYGLAYLTGTLCAFTCAILHKYLLLFFTACALQNLTDSQFLAFPIDCICIA